MRFDDWADFVVERGDGRYITTEGAKDLLLRAEAEGLLIEAVNNELSKNDCICLCCVCCCGPLKMLKAFPGKAIEKAGNCLVKMDKTKCTECGICIERCPMDVMYKEGDTVRCDLSECVDCGLCSST